MATRKRNVDARRFLITQMLRFDYGKILVHRILAPVSFVLSAFTLLKVYDVSFDVIQMGGVAVFAVGVMFVAGFVWDRCGFVEEEIEYGNERNRFVHVMLDGKKETKKAWLKKLQKARINK